MKSFFTMEMWKSEAIIKTNSNFSCATIKDFKTAKLVYNYYNHKSSNTQYSAKIRNPQTFKYFIVCENSYYRDRQ